MTEVSMIVTLVPDARSALRLVMQETGASADAALSIAILAYAMTIMADDPSVEVHYNVPGMQE